MTRPVSTICGNCGKPRSAHTMLRPSPFLDDEEHDTLVCPTAVFKPMPYPVGISDEEAQGRREKEARDGR